ncbi:MAG: chalcone isomerase family protein [Bacteriovoracaceae bacterium]|nr:chalcone isomerase family protein [Bacteriovoracaceae bacterium]
MKYLFLSLALISSVVFAEPMVKTGEGIRQKKILFVKVDVYKIKSFIQTIPTEKTRKAIQEANVDKALELIFMRSVDAKKITTSLVEAYENCGFKNKEITDQMVKAFNGDFNKEDRISINYTAADQKITMVSGNSKFEASGAEVMNATWCIWFGKGIEEQPSLGDDLVKELR